jgi:neutral ceramidase
MKKTLNILFTFLIFAFTYTASAQTANLIFKAGAAKVDVTPSEKDLPKNIEGIHDRLYSRAIVIDNGETRAALITVDTGMIFEQLWKNVTQKIEKELGIPTENILLTPTHTHSSIMGPHPGLEDNIFESG